MRQAGVIREYALFGAAAQMRYTEPVKALRRGWFLGSEAFKREMLSRMEGCLGGHHAGELHQEAARAKAERIIAEELQRHGWQEQELVSRRKNDATKLVVAARLGPEANFSVEEKTPGVDLWSLKNADPEPQKQLHGTARKA